MKYCTRLHLKPPRNKVKCFTGLLQWELHKSKLRDHGAMTAPLSVTSELGGVSCLKWVKIVKPEGKGNKKM